MMHRHILAALLALSLPLSGGAFVVDVTEFGAKGDFKTDNTAAIQAAIDKCADKGGGTVLVPSGDYLLRPVWMKSNVELHLDDGATLWGSTTLSDYDKATPYPNGGLNQSSGLIVAKGQENISITGRGTINGRGESPTFQFGDDGPGRPKRPKLIYFSQCKGVTVRDISLRNSAYWVQHYEECEKVFISGIRVYSQCNHNNDGLDLDVVDAIVSDCIFDSDDDAICFKSDHERPCENVVITNCIAASNSNGIKFGTASCGGFRNISVSNVVIRAASEDNRRHWQQKIRGLDIAKSVISGIAIESVDGGVIENISVSNVSMQDVQTPIVIRLADRRRKFHPEGGVLRGVTISNVTAIAHSAMASSITASSDLIVENVVIRGLTVRHPGGGTPSMAARVLPDVPASYPENRMFGDFYPCSGFFVRNAQNVVLSDIIFDPVLQDARPVFQLENVQGCTIASCRSTKEATMIRQDEACSDIKTE